MYPDYKIINMKNNLSKKLIAITTITISATAFANAQSVDQNQNTQDGMGQRMMQALTDAQKKILDQAKTLFESGKKDEAKKLLDSNNLRPPHERGGGRFGEDRKKIEEAIIAGNFTNFQTLASTSPLSKIDETTFNKLTPLFLAKKNAEDGIREVLKNAGIQAPNENQGNKQFEKVISN